MVILEIVLAICSAVGLLVLGWLLLGRLVAPVGRAAVPVVLPASGEARDLEQVVRGLLWLQGGGMARFTILVVDRGLDEVGRAVISSLKSRDCALVVCAPEEVERYIR